MVSSHTIQKRYTLVQSITCCQEAIELSDGGALLLTTSRWAEEGFSGVPAAPRLTAAVVI